MDPGLRRDDNLSMLHRYDSDNEPVF